MQKKFQISYLYLMKIQIYFISEKNFRFLFNENTDQFLFRKNFRFIFNENTDQFLSRKNFRSIFNENTN